MARSISDPRIDHRIENVDGEVHQDVGKAEQQHDALDDRVVAAQDGIDREAAEPGNGEYALGDHGAADQERDADADDRHDRHRGILERMHEQDAALADALGARGADVVLLQHLEHRRAGDAGDQRDVDAAERDRGQDQVFEPRPDPFRDRRIALDRQPFELEREHVGEQVADHEHRHREAEHGERHDAAVDPGAGLPGREHTDRHGDRHRQDQRDQHQRQRRLETLRDHRGDRKVGEDRVAEIAVQDLPDPFAEADQERPVEAEALADTRDIGGARLVAGDDRRRIARRDVEQAEHEQRHHAHDRDGCRDASNDVSEHGRNLRRWHAVGIDDVHALAAHAVLLTPQKKGRGPLTTPETFLRQA